MNMPMILKTSSSAAKISECGRYRYWLARDWYIGDAQPDPLTWIMLNPSTADAQTDDPTITRCMRRAAMLGFNGIRVVNLFGLRATQPDQLRQAQDPVGPDNDRILLAACYGQRMVIAGWGADHADIGDRAATVRRLLASIKVPVFALGLTKEGYPRHPLYMPYAAQPFPY